MVCTMKALLFSVFTQVDETQKFSVQGFVNKITNTQDLPKVFLSYTSLIDPLSIPSSEASGVSVVQSIDANPLEAFHNILQLLKAIPALEELDVIISAHGIIIAKNHYLSVEYGDDKSKNLIFYETKKLFQDIKKALPDTIINLLFYSCVSAMIHEYTSELPVGSSIYSLCSTEGTSSEVKFLNTLSEYDKTAYSHKDLIEKMLSQKNKIDSFARINFSKSGLDEKVTYMYDSPETLGQNILELQDKISADCFPSLIVELNSKHNAVQYNYPYLGKWDNILSLAALRYNKTKALTTNLEYMSYSVPSTVIYNTITISQYKQIVDIKGAVVDNLVSMMWKFFKVTTRCNWNIADNVLKLLYGNDIGEDSQINIGFHSTLVQDHKNTRFLVVDIMFGENASMGHSKLSMRVTDLEAKQLVSGQIADCYEFMLHKCSETVSVIKVQPIENGRLCKALTAVRDAECALHEEIIAEAKEHTDPLVSTFSYNLSRSLQNLSLYHFAANMEDVAQFLDYAPGNIWDPGDYDSIGLIGNCES
jgi:hypothetical protein